MIQGKRVVSPETDLEYTEWPSGTKCVCSHSWIAHVAGSGKCTSVECLCKKMEAKE